MKKILSIFIILITILFSCQTTDSNQIAGTAASLANRMAVQLLEKLNYNSIKNIAVLPFVESGTEESNNFSLYFADEMVTSLFKLNQKDLVIYERSQINQLMKEAEFAATGLISQETAVELGKMIGVDAVVIGSMKQIGNSIRINARSVSVESGKIAAVATGDLPIDVYETVLSSTTQTSGSITIKDNIKIGYTDIYIDGYLNQDYSGPNGLDSVLAEIIVNELGSKIEWVKISSKNGYFESIKTALNSNKVDMFISVTSIKPERKNKVLFSIPYTFQDGDDIAISFKTGNTQLKEKIDKLIKKFLKDGTIENLKEKFIFPVGDIFETNNTMLLLSHKFQLENLIINGNKADSEVDTIEVSYDKYWREFNKNGEQIQLARIIKSNYDDIEIEWLEVSNPSMEVGTTTVYHFDHQFLKDNNWATFDVLTHEAHQFGTVELKRID